MNEPKFDPMAIGPEGSIFKRAQDLCQTAGADPFGFDCFLQPPGTPAPNWLVFVDAASALMLAEQRIKAGRLITPQA